MSLNTRSRTLIEPVASVTRESKPASLPQGVRLIVYVNVTAQGGSGALVVTIYEEVPGTNQWVSLLASASLVAAGVTRMEVGPGIAVTANVSRNSAIAGRYKVVAAFSGTPPTDTLSYSVSCNEPTQA